MMDFGFITQQAGYQVQDFAVQVAGGQSALVALAQQGSQMLGFFGPAGAIAGAVLGVGVLASRLMDTAAQMKAAKEEADKLASSFERLRDARVSRAMSGADFQKQQQILTGEVSKAQKELAAIEAQAAHQSSMVAGASAQPRGGNVFVYENAESQRKAQEEIDAFWERNKGRTFLLGAENAHIESIAAKHGGVIKSAREAADDAAEALDGLMAPLNAARDKYEELAHQLKKIQEEHARAFEAQKTANAEAAMTSTERQADIQRQIDLLKKKGETETAEYAKLVGQQEAYARAFEAQKTANAEAAMTGTERQADIQRQIDLLKEKGQTETAEYAKLVGQQEEYARSLQQITTENSRFGESGLTTLNRLRDEMSKLDKDTIEYQEKLKQGQSIWAGYVAKADAIKDKQDPMRAIEREAKSIGELRREDLLTPEEAARAADDLIKSPEIPSALRTNAGASSLGGTAVNGSQVMDVAKSTLEEVKKLVEEARKQTRMWAGAN
jgi:chromosome segregation ATPase